jgi:hypothetical protein
MISTTDFVSRLREDFFLYYDIQAQQTSILPTAYRGNFHQTSRDRSISLTIHFYLDPTLRIRGALSPFPVGLSMGWYLVTEEMGFVLYASWIGGKIPALFTGPS